jgi:predicted metal-dependent hydrolase
MIPDYQLIRSRKRKKTISLALTREGNVVVRAPYGVTTTEIAAFVDKKKVWLNRKITELQARPQKDLPVPFIPGEAILYLGVPYPLYVAVSEPVGKDTLHWSGQAFHLTCRNLAVGKALLGKWYKKQGRDYFPLRVAHFSDLMGVVPSSIRVSSARFRFGSCSSRKRVSLSWRLMMAPLEVIDSVIVHELAHLKEMNHSSRFWSFVRTFCPDCDRHKKWLKAEGWSLMEF